MRQVVSCLVGAAALACGFAVSADPDKVIRITVENKTPAYQLQPFIEAVGVQSEAFANPSPNKFEYVLRVSDKDWFHPLAIVVVWKDAYATPDSKKSDLEQRIELRLRRRFPPNYYFPVYFSNDRSQDEMTRLEYARQVTQQFEVYFRSHQIATFYRGTLGPTHALTKRAAKLFFWSAIQLAETPEYFVNVSYEAEKFMTDAFGAKEFSERATTARSMYWHDLRQVDAFVANGECQDALLIMQALQQRKDESPAEYAERFAANPSTFDEKVRKVAAKCQPSGN
jgi:hypothetical protein